MTKEEAIAILIREIDEDIFVRTEYREQLHEALNMGIKALKQEPCKDAISRQKVLSKFKEVYFSKEWSQFRIGYGSNGQRDFLINYIEQLPSVTPQYTDAEIQKMQEMEQAEIEKAYELGKASQLKTGRWIFIRMVPEIFHNEYECSECGRRIRCTTRQLVNYPYCHCGTKMENAEMK